MLGYRFAFNPDKNISKSFTKPIYSFGLSINPVGAFKAYKTWNTEN